jgi:hypothetical protein
MIHVGWRPQQPQQPFGIGWADLPLGMPCSSSHSQSRISAVAWVRWLVAEAALEWLLHGGLRLAARG